jgi:hypothetical protein
MMAGTVKIAEYFSVTTDPHTSWINKAHGCNLICKVGKEQRTTKIQQWRSTGRAATRIILMLVTNKWLVSNECASF